MITIVSYKTEWSAEFMEFGGQLRQNLGDLALRIDHIGSTAVPGLAAKDIIDIQITVRDLTLTIENALNRAGYQRVSHITHGHLPLGQQDQAGDWLKWFFKPSPAQRAVNVHLRLPGRANQRYALLFRDYLRTHPPLAQAYARVKMGLAKHCSGVAGMIWKPITRSKTWCVTSSAGARKSGRQPASGKWGQAMAKGGMAKREIDYG
jgi:GrpB-like predicted nucleotidyltransferase (UPF0157 family)